MLGDVCADNRVDERFAVDVGAHGPVRLARVDHGRQPAALLDQDLPEQGGEFRVVVGEHRRDSAQSHPGIDHFDGVRDEPAQPVGR
jgi:hypothetical protein